MLLDEIRKFYYDLTLDELRRMHESAVLPALSYNGLLYLDLIGMTPDCTVSGLSDILRISKPAVTMRVNELLRLGLVEKTRSATDKRVNHLTVRPEVAAEYSALHRALGRAVGLLEARYSKEEVATFCAMLAGFSRAYVGDDEGVRNGAVGEVIKEEENA